MKERNRISAGTKVVMLGVAAFFETLQLLLGMLWALGPALGGTVAGILASEAVGGGWLGSIVGWVVGTFSATAALAVMPLFFAIGILFAYMVGILAWCTFIFWFLLRGIPPVSPKNSRRAAITALGFMGEMIPFLQLLPLLTISVYMVIADVQKEDREYNKKMKARTSNTSAARSRLRFTGEVPQAGNDNILPSAQEAT